MRPSGKARVCLATATTERFVPGTLVLIGSFLRHHPGFDGDVVVVHDDGLPERLRDTPHTKQFLQNRYFAGRQTLIGSTYNFLLASAQAIRAREGVDIESARVLHYVKAVKPWSPEAMLRWARDPGSAPAATAFRFWYDAYLDVLARAHVRTGARGRAGWTFA